MMRRFLFCSMVVLCSALMVGCSRKKTTSVIDTQKPGEQVGTIKELDTSLFPTALYGTKRLSIDGNSIYLQDDGMREVFVRSDGETERTDAIVAWLTRPGSPELLQALFLKQATIGVGGDRFVVPGGASLFPHLVAYNAQIVVSGTDLIVEGQWTQEPFESYLIVKDTLPENYLLNSPWDWFGPAITMIPRGSFSLLKIQWGSPAQSVGVFFDTGENTYSLSYGYEDRYAGYIVPYEEVVAPAGSKLRIAGVAPSPDAEVYHISLREGALSEKSLNRLDGLTNQKANELIRAYLTTQKTDLDVASIQRLSPTNSGDRMITMRDAVEQLVLVVEPTYLYIFPLHNYPFTLELQLNASDEWRPYYSRFLTPYMLDEQSVNQSLNAFFGTGNVSYDVRDKGFSYQIQPKQTYSGMMEVMNIFGQKASVNATYLIETISPNVVTQQIVSNNTISILPKSGSFKDVLIQYKNIPSFSVSFQACTIDTTPDLVNQSKGVGVENYLFECTGPVVNQDISPVNEDFVYRKAYRTPLSIPASLSGASAFRVFFKDIHGQEQSHYMLKSDLGVRTKIANNQLWIWGFVFETGEPIAEGSVNVTNLRGETIGTSPLVDGMAVIDLPNADPNDPNYYQLARKNETYIVQMSSVEEETVVLTQKAGRSTLTVPVAGSDRETRSLQINSKLDPNEVTPANASFNQRGVVEPMKIYGYTDRGLYKAGDTLYFAGRVRNVMRFGSLDYLQDKTVSVTITDPMGGDPVVLDNLPLDTYGGFVGSYDLPSTLPLGEYVIQYIVDEQTTYGHNIKVEEYQKPTFFADLSHETKDDLVSLVMRPTYFFGTPLQSYDVQVNWSLVGKDICWYCRWWNDEDYYFNHVFNDMISTGGSFSLYNQSDPSLTYPLYEAAMQANQGYQYTLKVDAIVKDRLSDETQFVTKYIDFKPTVMIGLDGQPFDRLYRDGQGEDPRTTWTIKGVVTEGKSLVDKVRYEVYYRSYDQDLQQGVDGNLYYVNGQGYLPVTSGVVSSIDAFTLPGGWITKPGEYFIRVVAVDKQDAIVGEVQKRLSRYESSASDNDLLGAVPNNYTLSLAIPKKTYAEGEEIPLNIVPYQRGARVVVTVERGQYILDSFVKQLDGNQLSIPVKRGYAPNVVISVMMLQGTEMNESRRQEPRFFAGWAEAQIDTAMHTLNIQVQTDKQHYLPGDLVTMTITTTDDAGKPIDARVSVAVIDQALASLYTLLKEPIPYFFNKIGSSVATFTNMKLLYQSLRAFATDGSKGGGGQGGKAMFAYIRDELKDAAYWSGALYTVGGRATVSFVAPENLTTRLVDAIGITTDTRLGTTTTDFVVKKDLIIEPNPPLFVTIGDRLQIPVKLIVPSGRSVGGKIDGSAWIHNQFGEKIALGTFSSEPNSTIGLDVSIPQQRWTSQYVVLVVEGTYGSSKDGIEQIIPLRTEGLISRDSVGMINQAGTHQFSFPDSLTQSLSVRLAQLPTNFIDPVAAYLIRYPYGCTEQLLSSLLPLVALDTVAKQGVFTSSVLSGSLVYTEQGPIDMRGALRDGVAKLLTHQRPDGGFGYRPYGAQDEQILVTRSTYLLSAYVYNALRLLQQNGGLDGLERQLDRALVRLDDFLQAYRTVAEEGRYRYLYAKVSHGDGLTAEEQSSLEAIQINEYSSLPLLRYLIAVAQQDKTAIQTWRQVATIPTNQDEWSDISVFFNSTSAEAMKLRAMIDDPFATQQERSDLLLSLLSRRGSDGLRGWSTQANVQVLLTLAKLSQFWEPKDTISCAVTIDGDTQDLTITPKTEGMITMPLTTNETTVDRSCDGVLLADVAVSYVPKQLDDLLGASTHVFAMNRSISDPQATIGSTVDIVGSFSTDIAGEQVAVELFVPSDYKLLDVISSNQPVPPMDPYGYGMIQQYPFDVSDPHCLPRHWETRFDRLFLYYDVLEPGTCDITIPALKAYNGSTTIMPMRVWEMYRGKINGRKVIVR